MLELEEAPAGSLARPAETGYSFGVEEEYFLAHQDSMDVVTQAPAALFDMLEKTTWDRASHESLQAQIEVSTEPHNSAGLLKDQLRFLRTAASMSWCGCCLFFRCFWLCPPLPRSGARARPA